jgi:hypothetical protein
LQFLPPVTANAQAIGQWNEMIAQFRDRPVQFVWIATENWSVVKPFLREHPMDGWLLIDEKNEAARAYGCEMGGDVIINPSGRIAGFTQFPDPEQLAGVLDGKAVRLETEPIRMLPPHAPGKPDIAPSYEVHISPSKTQGTEGSSGADFWVQRGFDLKTMISLVYEKDISRVIFLNRWPNRWIRTTSSISWSCFRRRATSTRFTGLCSGPSKRNSMFRRWWKANPQRFT